MRTWWWLLNAATLTLLVSSCGSPTPRASSPTTVAEPAHRSAQAGVQEPDVAPSSAASARVPAAVLAIDPQPAPQSGQVNISGSGFVAGEPVSISVPPVRGATADALVLGNAVTGADGAFDKVTLVLPDELQSGPHAIEAVGQASARRGTATLWIRAPQPWLVMNSYDVQQYGDVGLIAGGFEPMDQVQVSLEPGAGVAGATVTLASVSTDQAGNGEWTQIKLPRMTAGSYTVVLRGQASAAELRRDMRVTPLKPLVELSPWAGPPGVPVQLNAKGFAPSERIQVSFAGTQTQLEVQADEYGNLWGAGPVRVPQQAPSGSLALNLLGEDSGATASPEFKVLEPKPWLELTSWSGAPGAPVGFAGGGWIGGELITVHIGRTTNPSQATGTADDNGWLKEAGQIYVPNDAGDSVVFIAVGEQSHMTAAATFTVILPFGLRPRSSPQVPVPGKGA